MLESKYVNGKTIPPFDRAVNDAVDSYFAFDDGTSMMIGIHNLEGEVYRVIKATGLSTYLYITTILTEMGFKDVLMDNFDVVSGFDSLFVMAGKLKQ